MSNLETRPNRWNPKKCESKVIIETPKGHRKFALGGLLPEGLAFPFDFGFIGSTWRRMEIRSM
jgi:inorganic pyrophosphatase